MDFSKRLPVAQNLATAIDWRIKTLTQLQGWELPCTVVAVDDSKGFVTVNFEVQNTPFTIPQITIPVIGWEYIRLPIQIGDRGITRKIDVEITSISGQGSTPPNISNAGNLTGVLAFAPIMNKEFVNSPDPNAVLIYGPNGVILRTVDGVGVVVINTDAIVLNYGGNTIVMNEDGIEITGTLTINGTAYLSHQHSGVQTGGGNTGGVV
jgi:hypothetical protein